MSFQVQLQCLAIIFILIWSCHLLITMIKKQFDILVYGHLRLRNFAKVEASMIIASHKSWVSQRCLKYYGLAWPFNNLLRLLTFRLFFLFFSFIKKNVYDGSIYSMHFFTQDIALKTKRCQSHKLIIFIISWLLSIVPLSVMESIGYVDSWVPNLKSFLIDSIGDDDYLITTIPIRSPYNLFLYLSMPTQSW